MWGFKVRFSCTTSRSAAWDRRLAAMSLMYNLAFIVLGIEVFGILFLVVPLPGALRHRILARLGRVEVSAYVTTGIVVLLGLIGLLFMGALLSFFFLKPVI